MNCYSCHSLGKTSPAVADGLCVECGARKWAAELWRDYQRAFFGLVAAAHDPNDPMNEPHRQALLALPNSAACGNELARLATAKVAFDFRPCGCAAGAECKEIQS